jgi:DNA recombination protein RmuC
MDDLHSIADALLANTPALMLAIGTMVSVGVIVVIAILIWQRKALHSAAGEQRMAELNARIQTMGDLLAKAQSQLQQTVHERLDAVTARLGESLQTSTKNTADHLQQLHSRLSVIDTAQKNITDLASQMTSLQTVLSSKQQRGAFGQSRMEVIIQDGLPKGCYDFQFTLSNRVRPDCCILMPDKRRLAIDAKFPLEAMTAYREAKTDDGRTAAARQVRQDIGRHISDISGKYLIPGETHDLALMFVPSESVYADLYDSFDDIIQKAFRSRVVIVSPSLLMLAVQVIQQIQKDARMREAADKIHAEVGHLMDDLGRLRDRVSKLGTHFGQANEDVRQILISAEKVEKRGVRIRDVEFDGDNEQPSAEILPGPGPRKLEAGE